jgi:undecaprenyl-phosphate 4-deoxy-4-formamido-L-arabinose transferase
LICSLFVIGGVQLFALGMIGEYLGRLFLKMSGQPQFVVREIVARTDRQPLEDGTAPPDRVVHHADEGV